VWVLRELSGARGFPCPPLGWQPTSVEAAEKGNQTESGVFTESCPRCGEKFNLTIKVGAIKYTTESISSNT